MSFECWLVIALDIEEIFEICLTVDDAIKKSKALKDSSGYDVTIEKVSLSKAQIFVILKDFINSNGHYDYCPVMFGLPKNYFELKEQEKAEKEIEELTKFVEIISDMDKEN